MLIVWAYDTQSLRLYLWEPSKGTCTMREM